MSLLLCPVMWRSPSFSYFSAYTSLLRITTVPPAKDDKSEHRDSTSEEEHVVPTTPASAAVASPTSRSGLLPNALFRPFTRTRAPDLERGQ